MSEPYFIEPVRSRRLRGRRPANPGRTAGDGATSPVLQRVPRPGIGAGGLVLIVDDDEASRLVLQWGLSRAGCTALPVDDGRHVWPILERERVGVVVVDLRMQGMDGFEVIRRLRGDTPDPSPRARPKILVVSGLSEPGISDRVLAAGADAFQAKPIDIFAVISAVRRLQRIGPMGVI